MNKYILSLGIFALIISIYQALALKQAHFYSLFSIGMFIILLFIYNKVFKKELFLKWSKTKIILFFLTLTLICIFIDKIGMFLNYWDYPSYTTFFDEILKYLFEWVAPFMYITLSFMIGIEIFRKFKFSKKISIILSFIIFGILIGFITDTINMGVSSWRITNMPITNLKLGSYFIIFSTIGYWLMIGITYITYKLFNNYKK